VLGFLSALFFGVAFILYAAKAGTSLPWTPAGFGYLGLLFLALHASWPWYPSGWRRPP
jgi:hypothetical protein